MRGFRVREQHILVTALFGLRLLLCWLPLAARFLVCLSDQCERVSPDPITRFTARIVLLWLIVAMALAPDPLLPVVLSTALPGIFFFFPFPFLVCSGHHSYKPLPVLVVFAASLETRFGLLGLDLVRSYQIPFKALPICRLF